MGTVRRDSRIGGRIVESFDLPDVQAGSAIMRFDGRLLAIRSDAFMATWIDPATRKATTMPLSGQGRVLGEGFRPDYQSGFVDDKRVWVLGSGSTPNRCYVSRIDMTSRKAPLFNATPMFSEIERAIGRVPNIQGAVLMGDRLRLFHRVRNVRSPLSFVVDISMDGFPGGVPKVLDVQSYKLGKLGPALLGFTDVTPMNKSTSVMVAVSRQQGRMLGAVVGMVAADGIRLGPLRESDGSPCRRRVRGIALNERRRTGWLITDPIDKTKPSRLCWAEFDLVV